MGDAKHVQQLTGNLQGLTSSDKRKLERIYRRRLDPRELVSPELAALLCECSRDTGRQVGVLVDRRGNVEYVIVGDNQKLFLPDLGPRRAGIGRFRGVRLVHTHLRGEPLSRDDLMDLAKLRLDLVAAIQMRPDGSLGPIAAAHLLPANPEGEQWRMLEPISVHELQRGRTLDFLATIEAVEAEFTARARAARLVDDGRDRAVLVFVPPRNMADEVLEARKRELRELCRTAGVRVLDEVTQRRHEPDPRWLIGKGRLDDLITRALQGDATLLVFDHDLLPAQARNISDAVELKVIDRTMLILDIFAQHAHSRDGKLQVELAQLKYTLPRLHEKNTMMSRLTGGIGGRGPGETKLEINRRRAREKVHQLEQQIVELGKRRAGRRSLREKNALPVVAIVGYTNAGKSTLLNTLTHGDVLAEDKLFATLDPTSRRLRFPDEREIILTDTVGFIRDLPKDLVAAFRATLEELAGADLLLHVVDAAEPEASRDAQIAAVERILADLELAAKPRLVVFNKIDRIDAAALGELQAAYPGALFLSALAAETTRALLRRVEETLWREDRLVDGATPTLTSSSSP
jgi:GTP-binding protein HflX